MPDNLLNIEEQEYLLLINHSLFSTALEGLSQYTGIPQSRLEEEMLKACQQHIAKLDDFSRQEYVNKCLKYIKEDYKQYIQKE